MDECELISKLEAVRLILAANRSALDMFAALGNQDWYEQGEIDAFLSPNQWKRAA